MVGPLGYLVFTDCIGLRKQGRDRRSVIVEYNPGQELEVYQSTPDMQLFVDEGVVEVMDANRKPCTWKKLCDSLQPKQRPVTIGQVKAETRPVKRKKK